LKSAFGAMDYYVLYNFIGFVAMDGRLTIKMVATCTFVCALHEPGQPLIGQIKLIGESDLAVSRRVEGHGTAFYERIHRVWRHGFHVPSAFTGFGAVDGLFSFHGARCHE
jgi:hypothetical protein